MLKSLGIVGDQDEETQTKNALLDLVTIIFYFQTIRSTLQHLNDQRKRDDFKFIKLS